MTHHVELRCAGNWVVRAEAETRLDIEGGNQPPSVILYKNLAFTPTGEVLGSGREPMRHVYRLASTARLINVEGAKK